jgi:DNA-binding transcriptional regulator LsrR (DeoR family)
VIGVAAGALKARPVAAALEGSYLTSLVIDEAAARLVIDEF